MLTHFVSMLADEILSDVQGPHRISHRILAQLLFGIVRIYSKKVYYLYHDCKEIRSLQLRQCEEPSASTGVSSPVSTEGLSVRVETEGIVRTSVVTQKARVPHDLPTFKRPKILELDSFDLGIAEDM